MSRFRLWKTVCIVFVFCGATAMTSPAQTLTTLVNFTGKNGAHPDSSLIQATDGNFYGNTFDGGANNDGTVFKINPAGILTTLHSFDGTDGQTPEAGLVQATDGKFYGTTGAGGSKGYGTVFKITSEGLTTLYSFCHKPSCTNGAGPWAGLVQATDGDFYGTTYIFGAIPSPSTSILNNGGTVFKITSKGALTTLYSFCHQPNCSDGSTPTAALLQGTDGNFYGTTSSRGAKNGGTVFKITSEGLTTLYSFCHQPNCSDGSTPTAALVQGTDGNFYGTTWLGGAYGYGTVFKINSGGTLTTLHSFAGYPTDGNGPYAGLVQATDGDFYGTTVGGGTRNDGTVFKITPGGTLTTLHSFVGYPTDGWAPYAGLVQATNGSFYGTTDRGGTNNDGTVFSLSPTTAQFVPVTPCRFADPSGCGSGGSGTASGTPIGDSLNPIAAVTINPSATAQAISPNFMSIAQDLSDTSDLVGRTEDSGKLNMNPIYKQLIGNLVHYQNAPMSIRVLSDSNITDHYKKDYLSPLCELNEKLGVQFFVGVYFQNKDDVTTASKEASGLVKHLPAGALQGIELGNEPDLYKPPVRDSGWDYNEYLAEYPGFAKAIRAVSGKVKLAVPVWSSVKSDWMDNLNAFITSQSESQMLSMVVIHHYSGTACDGSKPEPPTYLLEQPAVCGDHQPLSGPGGPGCPNAQPSVLDYVPTAQKFELPLRIGELNSINCKGQEGVSNSFSSALWAMDISFAYAQDGVSGVNFFNPDAPTETHPYSPFDFTYTDDQGVRTYKVRDINPLYYGMLMFAQAVQNKAQLLPITLYKRGHNIKAWATIDSGNTIRLLLLNKDLNASGDVTVSLTGYKTACITRLTAPFYYSITGLTLGGQTFDGSPDGTLQGTALSEYVSAAGDVYTVSLPEVSAALVTIPEKEDCQ